MGFLLTISFSPNILKLYLSLPSVCTSQILYPKVIVNVVLHQICFSPYFNHFVSSLHKAKSFITQTITVYTCTKIP